MLKLFLFVELLLVVYCSTGASAASCPGGWTSVGNGCYHVLEGPGGSYMPFSGSWVGADQLCKQKHSRAFLWADEKNLASILTNEIAKNVYIRPSFVLVGAGTFNKRPQWILNKDDVTIPTCSEEDLGYSGVRQGECAALVLPADYSNNYCMAYVDCNQDLPANFQYYALCQYIPSSVDCSNGGRDSGWELSQDGRKCYKFVDPDSRISWDGSFCQALLNSAENHEQAELAVIDTVATLMWMFPYLERITQHSRFAGARIGATSEGLRRLAWSDGTSIPPFLAEDSPTEADNCVVIVADKLLSTSPLHVKLHPQNCVNPVSVPIVYRKIPGRRPLVKRTILTYVANNNKQDGHICRQVLSKCSKANSSVKCPAP